MALVSTEWLRKNIFNKNIKILDCSWHMPDTGRIGKNEFEIAYFGLLQEYQNKKLGSFLLSFAIKKCFEQKINRVWVHTCSLDHDNALNNYLSRGMKIFKQETVFI